MAWDLMKDKGVIEYGTVFFRFMNSGADFILYVHAHIQVGFDAM